MNGAEKTAEGGDAARPLPRRGAVARALTLALLAGSVGLVVLTASPSLLSLAGVTRTSVADRRPFEAPPGFAIGDLDGRLLADDLDDEGELDPADEGPSPFDDLPLGAALESVKLVDSPSGAATITGELTRGDIVRVVKQQGEWALVLKSDEGTVAMGWTRRSTLAIR